jgi:signal transduction histidine kinase
MDDSRHDLTEAVAAINRIDAVLRMLPNRPLRQSKLSCGVLHEFLKTNRAVLIDHCRALVTSRSGPMVADDELAHGIPIFLDQLIETLTREQTSDPRQRPVTPDAQRPAVSEIGSMAALHGRDLHEKGFTLEQVVRDYGDVCQAVTSLAYETGAAIDVDEFRTFNRCLDNAIAGAVTEYAYRQSVVTTEDGFQALNSRLGPLAHELRNFLHTATYAVRAIKAGKVGMSGATGAVLDRSLIGMRNLIDRALAEVRVTAGLPPRLKIVRLADFLEEVATTAALDPLARECVFKRDSVEKDIEVYVDPEMLAAAVGNLLQNAFKFTQPMTVVHLHASLATDRLLIEVEDHCGGLRTPTPEKLLLPFVQSGENRSGLGLGLDICRRSVEANNGVVRVKDVPGSGCIFTIELPYRAPGESFRAMGVLGNGIETVNTVAPA